MKNFSVCFTFITAVKFRMMSIDKDFKPDTAMVIARIIVVFLFEEI